MAPTGQAEVLRNTNSAGAGAVYAVPQARPTEAPRVLAYRRGFSAVDTLEQRMSDESVMRIIIY